MARRTIEGDEAQLSLTPLIDVVLLLLIFFIITTVFDEREIELQLPESQSSQVIQEKKNYTIELGIGGAIAMNGEPTTVALMDVSIGREARLDAIRAVEIRADRRVVHGRVVEVLGIIKKHGVDNIGIAVKETR